MTLAVSVLVFRGSRFISVSRSALQQGCDGSNQRRSGGAQFVDAISHHLLEEFFAAGQKRNQNAAAVVAAAAPADIAVCYKAVDQFHDAVVFQRQALGECADGGFDAFGEAAKSQQNEILLRFEARGAGDGIAFAEEMANAVAQLGECAIFVRGDVRSHDTSLS